MSDKHDYLLELCELHHNNHLFLLLLCYVGAMQNITTLARDYVFLSGNSFLHHSMGYVDT